MSKNIEYIDIHSHLNFADYENDRDQVIERMAEEGVATVTVGTDLKSSQHAVALADKYPFFYACVGQHPADVPEGGVAESFDEAAYTKLLGHPKTVAMGECGLDYFYLNKQLKEGKISQTDVEKEKARQRALFRKQVELAIKFDKPLMLHCRETYGEILEILDGYFKVYGSQLRGNAHFFAGTLEEAQAFLDLGFTLSFTGVITFARQYEELVKHVPLDRLLSETDAPYVTPVPHRGKRNEPAHVIEVVEKMAQIKGISVESLKKQLIQNANTLFRISL
ncbi:MAG: TatD family hydrolase [Candidatus Pacebacteria bacterium]|nr:TatD family hydrolase [Candidatus Paceibacterota bacterium]